MNSEHSSVTLEAPVKEKVPVWLSPVLGFIVGAALVYGLMKPINDTPEYQRGYNDGFKNGRDSEFEISLVNEQRLYKAGIIEGRRQATAGE